jgi:AcrR family transcriptional regulator
MSGGDSTKQKILIAAGPIFARKGFAKTTVREICEAAGVNLASINYYFGDKGKLYAETLLAAQALQVRRNPQPVFDPETPSEVKLERMVATLLLRIMAMQTEPWQVRLIMREVLQPSAASQGLIDNYFRPFFDTLLDVIDELVGEVLPDGLRRQIGLSIVGQCMIYRTSAEMMARMIPESESEYFQIESLTKHISRFSLAAISGMRQALNETEFKPTSLNHG